jgi:hypothetical protein
MYNNTVVHNLEDNVTTSVGLDFVIIRPTDYKNNEQKLHCK